MTACTSAYQHVSVQETCIRKGRGLFAFALPGVFFALFLTDLAFSPPSTFPLTGVAKVFFFGTEDLIFNLSNGTSISRSGVARGSNTSKLVLLSGMGLSGISDSPMGPSLSAVCAGSKRTVLGLREGNWSGQNRLLTGWRREEDEEEEGVAGRGRFLGGVSNILSSSMPNGCLLSRLQFCIRERAQQLGDAGTVRPVGGATYVRCFGHASTTRNNPRVGKLTLP